MAITTYIGEVLHVKSPIRRGATQINGFTDVIVGETASRFFEKEFRYTTDMIHWSDWIELNTANLQSIAIKPQYDFQFEYKYTRKGTDSTGQLDAQTIELLYDEIQQKDPAIEQSIYGYFFKQPKDLYTTEWNVNVLNKLYEPGIVSKVLVRGESRNDNEEDRDYIDLWRSVAMFFGNQVQYARKFEFFDEDERLLKRYIENSGLYVGKDRSLNEMVQLMHNLHSEISERGTMRIVDGELLRLINRKEGDEFLFAPNNANTVGWTVNVSSPLNKYIHSNPFLEKISQESETTPSSLTTEKTPIDPTLPYELVFKIRGGSTFSATVLGYDSEGISASVQHANDKAQSVALQDISLAKTDEWYFVRVIVFPHDQLPTNDSALIKTNINAGKNLRWTKEVSQASISITGTDISLKEVKFKPLHTSYSRGIVGAPLMVETWMDNNGDLSNKAVDAHIRRYLLPHNVSVINNFIGTDGSIPITKGIYEDLYESIYQ